MNITFLDKIIFFWMFIGLVIFVVLWFVSAPYGRHTRKGWGWTIDNKVGWIGMEIVSPLVFGYFFWVGNSPKTLYLWFFATLWILHYLNRSILFPLRIQTKGKKMPLSIALSAVFFNSVNGFLNGYVLGNVAIYPDDWLLDFRFILGICLFVFGCWLNISSDEILLNLRKGASKGYQIPKGGLFCWVSNPNYLGEIIEWIGFACMTWTLSSWSFAWWTFANLFPRAWSNHQWYKSNFAHYPSNRKAIIPFWV